MLTNQESLRLQYALRQRAGDLGWNVNDIEVIDADLGLSGAGAEHRLGFKDLIARVTLGEVGIVLSYEVTRSRSQLFGLVSPPRPLRLPDNVSSVIATGCTIRVPRMAACFWASRGFGARISAWRHFKGCRADVYRGYHGGLSCRSSLIPRAVIAFPVSGIG